ncbi:MAG: peptidylprolyl isomerase [Polyangiales bacterium]
MRFARLSCLFALVPLLALSACRSGSRDGERAEVVRPSAAPAAPSAEPFTVVLDTTKGPIHIDVHPEWAPLGAARFRELVEAGYYTDVAFFRVIEGFMAQIGIHGDPAVNSRWRDNNIQDDPVTQSNTRGMLSFATRGPNTRTTQFFISFGDNRNLDGMGFSPFAQVRAADMAVVDSLYNGYGEGAPRGRGPDQGRMHAEGNTYLRAEFPELDYVRSARIEAN